MPTDDTLLSNQADALKQVRTALEAHRVVWLSGFPGTGKTQIIDAIARQNARGSAGDEAGVPPWKALLVEEADGDSDPTMHALAARFATARGRDDLDRAAPDPLTRLGSLLAERVVLVIDEAHRLLSADGLPGPALRALMKGLLRAGAQGEGRLLLVGVRGLGDDRDTERVARVHLAPAAPEEAVRLLEKRLVEQGREAELTPVQRRGAVNRLGRNPRALGYFARALERASAVDLLGGLPEAWEAVEPTLDAGLVHKFEREMLDQVLAGLDAATLAWLRALSVLRERVDGKALEALAPNPSDFRRMRDALAERYLLDQRLGRYRVEALARELLRARLRDDTQAHTAAHTAAGRLYTRHFTAKQIVAGRERDFVEARYHLAIAGDAATLGGIARRYVSHLNGEITLVSPVPPEGAARDERVTLLRALDAANALSPAHAYHLARVLAARGNDGDVVAACQVMRQRCAKISNDDVWVLRLRLEGEVGASAHDILRMARVGIAAVGVEHSVKVYDRGAEVLAAAGDPGAAVALLREGIAQVPTEKNVFVLYRRAAELLAAGGDRTAAVSLLREGIRRVPADKNVFMLYDRAAELLEGGGDRREAVTLLRKGISVVPADKGVHALYIRAVELLAASGAPEDAIALVCDGIASTTTPASGGGALVVAGTVVTARLGPEARARFDEALPSRPDFAFARAYRAVLDAERLGRWEEVPRLAEAGRVGDPMPWFLTTHAALGQLALGQPERAWELLQRLDAFMRHEAKLLTVRWLESLASLQVGEIKPNARKWGDDRLQSLASLRRAWASPRMGDAGHPSWSLPFLPPGLLGQPDAWVSPLDGRGMMDAVEALEAAERASTPLAAVSAPAAAPERASTTATITPPATPKPPPLAPLTEPPAWVRHDRPFEPAVIDASFTPGGVTGIHVLGSFDRRVTFHNQQLRALLSVRAMHTYDRIKPGKRVAVLGGGAAGLTAALAAHRLGAAVTVFERDTVLFSRQRAALHRWLHPHVYEWPARSLDERRAGLPFLDWEADRAQDVVVKLDAAFRAAFPQDGIRWGQVASHIERLPRGGFLLTFDEGPEHQADCVIVALGFGDDGSERPPPFTGDTTPDYWDPGDILEARVLGKPVVIGGNGDGGLIDAVRATWRGFRHHEDVGKLLDNPEGHALAAAMRAVDEAALARLTGDGDAPNDLLQQYERSLPPSGGLLERLRNLPKNADSVKLVAPTPGLFRLDTALVNRLLVYLLIKANRVTHVRGTIEPDAQSGWVMQRMSGKRERPPGSWLVLRRGPDPDYLKRVFPNASTWLVPDNRRVEALALTQELDADTWRFWAARAG